MLDELATLGPDVCFGHVVPQKVFTEDLRMTGKLVLDFCIYYAVIIYDMYILTNIIPY